MNADVAPARAGADLGSVDHRDRHGAIAAVIVAAMLFGTTGTARALGPDGTDPVVAGLLRLTISGPVLLLLARRGGRGGTAAARVPGTRLAVAAGAVCMAAYQIGFFGGLARTGVSVGTVIGIGSGPAFAGLLAFRFLNERPSTRWLAATAVALTGGVLIALAGPSRDRTIDLGGVALVLLAGLGYAGLTVLSRAMVVRGVDGAWLLGASFTAGAFVVAPFCIGRRFGWVTEPSGMLVVAWLAFVPTVIAYRLFARGLQGLSGPAVTTFMLAEPATAVVLGRLLLDERLAPWQWVGVAAVLAGIGVLAIVPDKGPQRR